MFLLTDFTTVTRDSVTSLVLSLQCRSLVHMLSSLLIQSSHTAWPVTNCLFAHLLTHILRFIKLTKSICINLRSLGILWKKRIRSRKTKLSRLILIDYCLTHIQSHFPGKKIYCTAIVTNYFFSAFCLIFLLSSPRSFYKITSSFLIIPLELLMK